MANGIVSELFERALGSRTGTTTTALLGLCEKRERLLERDREDLVFAREAAAVGALRDVRTEATVLHGDGHAVHVARSLDAYPLV